MLLISPIPGEKQEIIVDRIFHPSLVSLLSLSICFDGERNPEKEFKATISSIGGNLCKRKSACLSPHLKTNKLYAATFRQQNM